MKSQSRISASGVGSVFTDLVKLNSLGIIGTTFLGIGFVVQVLTNTDIFSMIAFSLVIGLHILLFIITTLMATIYYKRKVGFYSGLMKISGYCRMKKNSELLDNEIQNKTLKLLIQLSNENSYEYLNKFLYKLN